MVHTWAGALLFLGEEKDLSAGHASGLQQARTELLGKLDSWNVLYMGELPYIMCYVTAGDFVQFFALGPDMVVRVLHRDPIVVSTVPGVLQLTVATINIFRILHTLRASGPQVGAPTLFSVKERQDCTITFEAAYVCKVYHTAHKRPRMAAFPLGMARRGPFTEHDIDRLHTFFDRLFELRSRPACLEVPVRRPTTADVEDYHTLEVAMCPVGIQRLPETKEEFVLCFRCILRALDILHTQLGYIHCDVRWPNVITASSVQGEAAGTRWCLIDFGEVAPIGDGAAGSPAADLAGLAAMLMPREAVLYQRVGFDVPLDRLRALLLEPAATAAGVLEKATSLLG